jgi:hypothetical protein
MGSKPSANLSSKSFSVMVSLNCMFKRRFLLRGNHPQSHIAFLFGSIIEKDLLHASFMRGIISVGIKSNSVIRQTWLVRIIHRIQAMVRNMWKRRNKELHEKESCEAKLQEHTRLNDNIDKIFDCKRSISKQCMTDGAATYLKKKKEHLKRMRIKR